MLDSTASADTSVHATAEELRSLIREAEAALNNPKDGTSVNMDHIRSRLHDAIENGKTLVASTGQALKRQASKADDVIRANPYQSIGIAAGVGVILGFLIARGTGSRGNS